MLTSEALSLYKGWKVSWSEEMKEITTCGENNYSKGVLPQGNLRRIVLAHVKHMLNEEQRGNRSDFHTCGSSLLLRIVAIQVDPIFRKHELWELVSKLISKDFLSDPLPDYPLTKKEVWRQMNANPYDIPCSTMKSNLA